MNLKLESFEKIGPFEWEIPTTFCSDMRIPVRIFASEEILRDALGDNALVQAVNASTLPGMVDAVMVMPDVHQGYGFPIGGVAAADPVRGVVSPGGIGYDINCGVRLLASQIPLDAVRNHLPALATAIDQACPSGVGVGSDLHLNEDDLAEACLQGSKWALKRGEASREDIRRTEENGCLAGANPLKVSQRAMQRGKAQLGTLGAGNHFIEVDVVAAVLDPETAQVMGLQLGNLVAQIHTGSRGFGHQVCTDYVRQLQDYVNRKKIQLPDRQLVYAPIESQEGQDYLEAMRCAANFAFLNRQFLAYQLRRAFEAVLAGKVSDWHLTQVYDIAHNIGKFEEHCVAGKSQRLCVHRKGATRAFGPGSTDLPEEYRTMGQPVLVPGSMGTASWVLVGTETSMERSFGSSCHGAGRVMSRSQAKREVRGEHLLQRLEKDGIEVRAGSLRGLAEEAPEAYKNVDRVVDSVAGAGLARKVVRLEPVIVIKG
jgi:tRNA-splicing ligase RtcB